MRSYVVSEVVWKPLQPQRPPKWLFEATCTIYQGKWGCLFQISGQIWPLKVLRLFGAVNDRIMCLPKNFCHYSAVYSAESVSVIWGPFCCSAETVFFCRSQNNTVSVKISTYLPNTDIIQLILHHFGPFWKQLFIRQKQKLSVIFTHRNWFLCFGKKYVSVVHWFGGRHGLRGCLKSC